MAGRHHDSLYSPVPDSSLAIDRNASYDSAVYGASVGSNGYRYHPHATSVDGPPEHYDSDYAHAPEATPNLSHAMGRSAIRQPTLPRLHIPNSSPVLDAQRVSIAGSSFYSATAALSSSRLHSPSVRGPLSAPDASEDFRYHQLYEDPHRGVNMQVPENATPSTSKVDADAYSPQQRSVSPVQPVRRTTTTTVIACRQCRSRKIRCDSTRPHCSNCSRRGDQCEYDPAPKRRGPDKKPGTRQRRSKKRAESREEDDPAHEPLGKLEPAPAGSSTTIALPSPVPVPSPDSPSGSMDNKGGKSPRRRRLGGENSRSLDDLAERVRQQPMPTPNISGHQYGRPIRPLMQVPSQSPAPSLRISTDDSVLIRHPQPFSSTQPPSSEVSSSRYAVSPPSTSYGYDVSPPFPGSSAYDLGHRPPQADHPKFPSIPSAAVHAAQQGWWDAFLRSYSLREIATDLNFMYTENPPIALSFVNVRFLLSTLWDQTRRLTLQPAFVLASMALAMLIRSSETERGAPGRERAAFLRHSAQDALERAWREGVWVDASLAEAALIIAQYEASAHPDYHPDRLAHALGFLDELLSALGLTTVDVGRADVCRYAAGAAPVVLDAPMAGARCGCIPLGTPPPDPDSVWASALPWDPTWDEHRVRDEECRRVCWAALSLVTSFRAECLALARVDECAALRICDPANYLVLFPNEMYDRGQGGFGSGRQDDAGAHPKNAIWALFCRSMLLANFCSNVVGRSIETREARETQAEALHDSWNEAQAIQDALDGHVCNLHTAVAYLCRENISNAQMIITKGLRNLQGLPAGSRPGPLFNRRQAEEWIVYQDAVLKRVAMSIQYVDDPRGHQLTQRPFAVTWFYHQLAICLLLWENDTSLEDVLELAKSFLVPLDVMNALWPCELIEMQCRALRKRLTAHCRSAGHEPPPPADYTLPHQHAGHNP